MSVVANATTAQLKKFKEEWKKKTNADGDFSASELNSKFREWKNGNKDEFESEVEKFLKGDGASDSKGKGAGKGKAKAADGATTTPKKAPRRNNRIVKLDNNDEVELPAQKPSDRLNYEVHLINHRLVFVSKKAEADPSSDDPTATKRKVMYSMDPGDFNVVFGTALQSSGVLGKRKGKGKAGSRNGKRNCYNHFISECKDIMDMKKYPNSSLEGCENFSDDMKSDGNTRLVRAAAIWKKLSKAEKAEWTDKAKAHNVEKEKTGEDAAGGEGTSGKVEDDNSRPAKKQKKSAAPLASQAKVKAETTKKDTAAFGDGSDSDDEF